MALINSKALAIALGVSKAAISMAVKQRRIRYRDPDKKLFDLASARKQWTANRQRQRTPKPRGNGSGEDLADGLLRARLRRELALARGHELDLQERSGELVRKRAIERELAPLLSGASDAAMDCGPLVVPAVRAAKTEAQGLLIFRKLMAEALRGLTRRLAAAEAFVGVEEKTDDTSEGG